MRASSSSSGPAPDLFPARFFVYRAGQGGASIRPLMRIEQFRRRLRDLGANTRHEDAVLRAWTQLRSLDTRRRRAETENLARRLCHLKGVDVLTAPVPNQPNRFLVMNSQLHSIASFLK